ncbi:MAG: NAD-dependent epimerase/dehydratase family protein, partial [Solibacillus isronensis]
MQTVQQLEEFMTKPSAALVEDIKKIDGDILILGIAGKMGPTLAKVAKRAAEEAGIEKRIIGVARFSNKEMKEELEAAGIETITCDLMDEEQLAQLPDIPNIIFMAGNKFGTVNNEHFTWAMNTYVPGRVADKFKNS